MSDELVPPAENKKLKLPIALVMSLITTVATEGPKAYEAIEKVLSSPEPEIKDVLALLALVKKRSYESYIEDPK